MRGAHFGAKALSPARSLGLMQPLDHALHCQSGLEAEHEVDEIVAIETDGGIGIGTRHGQRGEMPIEHVERPPQVRERRDVAARRDIDPRGAHGPG